MSVIEDSRNVVQDFLAPELRSISVRLDALEKRFDAVDRKLDGVDREFDEVERRAEKRHDELLAAILRIGEVNSLRERLARLGAQNSPHQ
jgi:phage shock protein A